jgi:hypothetical protein
MANSRVRIDPSHASNAKPLAQQEAPSAQREPVHQPRVIGAREEDHVSDHVAPRLRTRRSKATVNEDQFYIPLDEIPEGLNYEWKRWENVGMQDPFYIARMREQGWEPVSPKMHPNWVPPGYNEPHIIKGGQILMERPMALTLEARKELRQLSKQQVVEAEQRLGMTGKGEATRDLAEVQPRISKEMMRPVLIEE